MTGGDAVDDPAGGEAAVSRASRPHVAIIVVNLPVERDRRVIRECKALESAGYRVTVICPRGGARLSRVPGTRDAAIRAFPPPPAGHGIVSFAAEFIWSFLFAAWHLTVLVIRERVVAAQVCNPPDVFWPLALVMRGLRRKWIFDHHDLCPELYDCKPGPTNRLVWRTLVRFERLSIRCASAVTTTNESYRALAIERAGCAPEKITVVRNGPATSEVAAPIAIAGESGRRQIVYLGVIGPQDRVDIAILAAERLAELRGRDGWELVVAGDGECLPDLRRMVDERRLHDIVRFTGWLEAAEVDSVLAGASIAIQPDPPTDMAHLSTMAKTIEYMARGVPVVAVDLVETRRSAEDAAVYVPNGTADEFAKALDGLLGDASARAAMREVALERFRTVLAWEHQAAAYVATWQTLVPTGADRAGAPSGTHGGDAAVVPRQRDGRRVVTRPSANGHPHADR